MLLLSTPFLFIAFFTYALAPYLKKSNFIDPFKIALVDHEDTAQSRILGRQLDELSIFSEVVRTDENEAEQLIRDNRIAAAVIIPQGFSTSVAMGENKPVTVIGNKAMPLQAYIVRGLIQSAASLVSASQSAINSVYRFNQLAGVKGWDLQQQFTDSTMKISLEALSRDEIFSEVENASGLNVTPAEYFTSALIAVFLMFAGMPAMKMLVTERSYGVSRRLAASPARTWLLLLSKFIVSLVISLVQFSIVIILTSAVFRNYWGAPPERLISILLSIIFASVSWSMLVSAVSRTSAAADAVGNLGILLMAVTGGSIYPLNTMPGFVRELSRFTINRWAMDGFMVIFSGNNAVSIGGCIQSLLLIGLAMLAAAYAAVRLNAEK